MIEKMQYISITGPLEEIDWAIENHLANQEIHLEYAIQKHENLEGLRTVIDENPYQRVAEKAEFFMQFLNETAQVYFPIKNKEATSMVESVYQRYQNTTKNFEDLEYEKKEIQAYLEATLPYSALPLWQLFDMKQIRCIFGKIPLQNFLQFQNFVYEDTLAIFIETERKYETIWGCFFTPYDEEIDEILAAYHFQQDAITLDSRPIPEIKNRLDEINANIQKMTLAEVQDKNMLLAACLTVQNLYRAFAIKQYAAQTSRHYIFVGWMPRKAAVRLQRETTNDERILITKSDNPALPPTKLVNPPIIRYFEFFVKLYGVPKYNEIDPTSILAITYTLLFGMMFGDVGHGLGLALLGWYLRPKHDLGGVMIASGLSSIVFGFLYGSIFGLENLLPALWRRPMMDIAGTLMFATALGVGIILLCMLLNILSALRQKNYQKLFFSPNGLAGMLGYILIITAILGITPWQIAVLPFIAVVVKGMSHQENASIGMTIFQRALGIFEILLAYLTNTVSFVRVGAFALSHAGMMHVVMSLSQGFSGNAENRNFVIFILGNAIVMSIEGLLIGIQSLRLGFYEIFSRFYEGGGQAFEKT